MSESPKKQKLQSKAEEIRFDEELKQNARILYVTPKGNIHGASCKYFFTNETNATIAKNRLNDMHRKDFDSFIFPVDQITIAHELHTSDVVFDHLPSFVAIYEIDIVHRINLYTNRYARYRVSAADVMLVISFLDSVIKNSPHVVYTHAKLLEDMRLHRDKPLCQKLDFINSDIASLFSTEPVVSMNMTDASRKKQAADRPNWSEATRTLVDNARVLHIYRRREYETSHAKYYFSTEEKAKEALKRMYATNTELIGCIAPLSCYNISAIVNGKTSSLKLDHVPSFETFPIIKLFRPNPDSDYDIFLEIPILKVGMSEVIKCVADMTKGRIDTDYIIENHLLDTVDTMDQIHETIEEVKESMVDFLK